MSGPLPLRALPRTFVIGATGGSPIPLPSDEWNKLRKVLRLSIGDEIAVLPGDGSVIRCVLRDRIAEPTEVFWPNTESTRKLTIAQALPKGDKLDEIVRACTEIGVDGFVFFPSDRSIVRWDDAKTAARLQRLSVIAREASEVSFRTKCPSTTVATGLAEVLKRFPDAIVLSEVEGLSRGLNARSEEATLVIGPEGGWSERELGLIGDRGVTLGPRVLRVDHAGPAAAALLLLNR